MQQGWECPKCKTIWAPSIICCSTCSTLRVVSIPSVWACTCGQGVTSPCPMHPNRKPYAITSVTTVSAGTSGTLMYTEVS